MHAYVSRRTTEALTACDRLATLAHFASQLGPLLAGQPLSLAPLGPQASQAGALAGSAARARQRALRQMCAGLRGVQQAVAAAPLQPAQAKGAREGGGGGAEAMPPGPAQGGGGSSGGAAPHLALAPAPSPAPAAAGAQGAGGSSGPGALLAPGTAAGAGAEAPPLPPPPAQPSGYEEAASELLRVLQAEVDSAAAATAAAVAELRQRLAAGEGVQAAGAQSGGAQAAGLQGDGGAAGASGAGADASGLAAWRGGPQAVQAEAARLAVQQAVAAQQRAQQGSGAGSMPLEPTAAAQQALGRALTAVSAALEHQLCLLLPVLVAQLEGGPGAEGSGGGAAPSHARRSSNGDAAAGQGGGGGGGGADAGALLQRLLVRVQAVLTRLVKHDPWGLPTPPPPAQPAAWVRAACLASAQLSAGCTYVSALTAFAGGHALVACGRRGAAVRAALEAGGGEAQRAVAAVQAMLRLLCPGQVRAAALALRARCARAVRPPRVVPSCAFCIMLRGFPLAPCSCLPPPRPTASRSSTRSSWSTCWPWCRATSHPAWCWATTWPCSCC